MRELRSLWTFVIEICAQKSGISGHEYRVCLFCKKHLAHGCTLGSGHGVPLFLSRSCRIEIQRHFTCEILVLLPHQNDIVGTTVQRG